MIAIQTVADFELLHEDVAVAVFPALDHHTTHHLILAQIHLMRSYSTAVRLCTKKRETRREKQKAMPYRASHFRNR